MALDGVTARQSFAPQSTGALQSLRNGQVFTATVASASPDGSARLLSATAGSFDARLPGTFQPGTAVELQVQRAGQEIRLLLLGTVKPGAAAPPAPLGSAPELALAGALKAALGTQNALAPLLANLVAVTGNGTAELPAAVHSAIEKLVAFHLPADEGLDGETLRTALLNSGLLYEAKLAGQAPPAQLGSDMKGILLALQAGLRAWLGTSPHGKLGGDKPAPPLKGSGPALPGAPSGPVDLAHLPSRDIGRLLLAQAEAALARLRLAQIASLPDEADRARTHGDKTADTLTFELPFAVGERSLVVQFQLKRDRKKGRDGPEAVWQVSFAFDAEPLGPVRGSVILQGPRVSVRLWAEREDGARILRRDLGQLEAALSGAVLDLGDVQVLTGKPETRAPAAGAVVNRMS